MAEFRECKLCKILYDGVYRARRADGEAITATILYETEEKRTNFLIQEKTKKTKRGRGERK